MEGFNDEQVKQLRAIVGDVVDERIKPLQATLDEHTGLLNEHTALLNDHTARFAKLDKHTSENFESLSESIMFIIDHMATKDETASKEDVAALTSKIAGLHNRDDQETAARKNLETRVRTVIPNLPAAPELV